jgi:hypothetical protein
MAKAPRTKTGNVDTVEHAGTSHMGNPTYRVTFTDGRSYLTETDGSIGYAATNYRPHSLNEPVVTVVATFRGGRIIKMERVDPQS